MLGLFLPNEMATGLLVARNLRLSPRMNYEILVNPSPPPTGETVLRLLLQAFSHMEGRIDPPSSLMRLNAEIVTAKIADEDLIIARHNNVLAGCLFAEQDGDTYHLGKIAVAHAYRQQGIARTMIEAAAHRAGELGLPSLALKSRVELTENHAAFNALGFRQDGTYTHPGFSAPTSLVFTRPLSPATALS